MPTKINGADKIYKAGWRFKLGSAMLLMSIVGPLVVVPLITTLSLSGKTTASLSGVILVGADLLMVAAVAVMGKEGYETIKAYASSFLKRYGPPDEVSQPRYTVGLIMFIVAVLFGWLAPYFQILVFDLSQWTMSLAIAGDLLLLLSLFVLGGDFWDKLRSLFRHDAKANFAVS